MKKYEFKYLSQEDILKLDIPYVDVIETVEKVMAAYGRGECVCPPKVAVVTREYSFINAMPSYLENEQIAGMKWVAGYPKNREKNLPVTWGLLVLNDCDTGAPLLVMDCRWCTSIRTGAVAAISAKYCKNSNTQNMTIIGAGEQGRWSARLIKITVPELKKIFISDINENAFKSYVKKMQPLLPDVEIVSVVGDELQEAIDLSQILLTATQRMSKPIIYKEMLHKGMLGLPLEGSAWESSIYTDYIDRFVCDDWELIKTYEKRGYFKYGLPKDPQILGKCIIGKHRARKDDDEFVLARNPGMSISDIAVANKVYKLANERNIGTTLPLLEEEDILR